MKLSLKLKIALIFILLATAIILLFKINIYFPLNNKLPDKPNFWGVTYSKTFASSLGLNWQETFLAIIDDLKVKQVRLPIYWNDIEKTEGSYNLNDYNWILNEGAKRNVQFILVIGRRVPRWPECHQPNWLNEYSKDNQQLKTKKLLAYLVENYKNRPEIITWQVENEPLLDAFGICPKADYNFLREEVELVKALDGRPILITGSGELSNWKQEGALGDYFGTTLYRTVWSQYLGYLKYPLPPQFYTNKAWAAKLKPEQRIIAELQAEPWAPNSTLDKLPNLEIQKSFSPAIFENNLHYAYDTGFNKVYLWGVEWWYLEKLRGNSEYWNIAKSLKW